MQWVAGQLPPGKLPPTLKLNLTQALTLTGGEIFPGGNYPDTIQCFLEEIFCVVHNMFMYLIMTALLTLAVCSKISLTGDSCRLADFCSMRAATGGHFRTDYSSQSLLLLNVLFFINVFDLAISADHHTIVYSFQFILRLLVSLRSLMHSVTIPYATLIVQGVIFFHLKMLVNLNQYRVAIGAFNNRNLATNKKISISLKVIVWESIFYSFQLLM